MKKLIIIIIVFVLFGFMVSQVGTFSDILLSNRIVNTSNDTLIAPYSGSGNYFKNVRYATDSLDAVPLKQMQDSMSSGGGNWTQTGSYLYPTTITDSIGINDATPSYNFDLNGTFRATGTVFLDSAGKILTPGSILNGSDSLIDADAVYDYCTGFVEFSDTVSVIATKYDLDTLTSSVYSLGFVEFSDTSSTIATKYDLDTIGTWTTWTPTLTWTGGIPTVNSGVYKYTRIGNKINFLININATNESGSTITGVTVTLPVTPKDINAIYPIANGYIVGASDMGSLDAYIDANDNTGSNRKIKTTTFAFTNSDTWIFGFSHFYEVDK